MHDAAGDPSAVDPAGYFPCALTLYDTAGQERFAPLTRPFYRQADGILLTYDVGDRGSFERAANYWLSEIAAHATPDALVTLPASGGLG